MYQYKLNKIYFKSGIEIEPNSLTVIVGPNNSGKSRILKDIRNLTTTENRDSIVLSDVDFSFPDTLEELLSSYQISTFKDENGNYYLRTLSSSMSSGHNLHVGPDWEKSCSEWIQNKPPHSLRFFCNWFGNYFVTLLGTEDRLRIVQESPSGNVNKEVVNLLQAFYKEGKVAEDTLREIVRNTFGVDIKLDYTSLVNLVCRVGQQFDNLPIDPRDARLILESCETLDDQGDGIKSFISTILAILVGKRPVLLLDEPEAFLHPPQAMRLGELIAEQSNQSRQIIIATHSSDLLRGILNVRTDINILRVNKDNRGNEIKPLNASDVAAISKDPILSSSRILDGLFYKGVVVVEADSDSIFYQRVSRQIRNSDEVHYTHAHNKQTIAKVLTPYINLGIKFATIVDFDVLRVRDEFKALISKVAFTDQEIIHLLELQSQIVQEVENVDSEQRLKNLLLEIENLLDSSKKSLEDSERIIISATRELKKIRENNSPWSKCKAEGFTALSPQGQAIFIEIDKMCRQKGIFIVPVGELESWLTEYGIDRTANKSRWIVKALEGLANIPFQSDKHPWKFVEEIHMHLVSR